MSNGCSILFSMENSQKMGFLGKKIVFVCGQSEENRLQWRQNRDISLSKNADVLLLMRKIFAANTVLLVRMKELAPSGD